MLHWMDASTSRPASEAVGNAFVHQSNKIDTPLIDTFMNLASNGSTCLQVSTGVKWARESGALPPPDPSDLKPPTPDADDDDVLDPEGKLPRKGRYPCSRRT